MVRFHGVMLNLSIDNKKSLRVQDLSGDRMKVNLDHDYIVNIYDYPVWAAKVFTLNRFKQICTDHHLLVTSAIRCGFAINTVTIVAKAYFMIEPQF